MEFKQLVKKERAEKKMRLMKETDGAYILYYLAAVFHFFVSMLYGFETDNSVQAVRMYWFLNVGTVCLHISFNRYIYLVKEKGMRRNIFEKYNYIPIDFKKLYLAKAVTICRSIMCQAVLGQLAALFIVAADPGQEGAAVTDFHVWFPILSGVIALFTLLLTMGFACGRAHQKMAN